MSAREELSALYDQWRKLTACETEAIRHSAWEQLEAHQSAKASLQPLLARQEENLDRELSAPFSERDAIERHFRAVVDELIRLEVLNGELLAAQRQNAEVQKSALERTSRNLRHLHRSYGPGADNAHWQSYS